MKKLFFMVPFLLGTILFAQPENYDSLVFSKGIDAKVKWWHCDDYDYLDLEACFNGRMEFERSWLDAKVKFTSNNVDSFTDGARASFDRLLLGYKLVFSETSELAVQIGHEQMDELFTSKILFGSEFNGAHVKYTVGNFTLQVAHNLIDSVEKHHGFIAETSYSNILGMPLTLTYSISDWLADTDHLISHVSTKMQVVKVLDMPVVVYGAFLRNHQETSHANAMYSGFKIGEITKANDWFLDARYKHAGENAIPYHDENGIMRGVEIKTAYAVTNNFTLQAKVMLDSYSIIEFCGIYKW